jgi:hypothetical protein
MANRRLVARRDHHQDIRQRPDLGAFAMERRRLHPRIFAVVVEGGVLLAPGDAGLAADAKGGIVQKSYRRRDLSGRCNASARVLTPTAVAAPPAATLDRNARRLMDITES